MVDHLAAPTFNRVLFIAFISQWTSTIGGERINISQNMQNTSEYVITVCFDTTSNLSVSTDG